MSSADSTVATSPATTSSPTPPPALNSFPAVPLTTVFTPTAPICTGLKFVNSHFVYGFATSCMPPGFNPAETAFYSPGIACPAGYYVGCHDNAGVASITTVTCCPSRADLSMTLSCVNSPWTQTDTLSTLFCTWRASCSPSCPIVPYTPTIDGTTSTLFSTLTSGQGVNAYGVRMVFEATDEPSTATITTKASSTSGSSTVGGATVTVTATPQPSNATSAGSLSTGDKAAIGTVVPLAVMLILAALGWFLWRRKRNARPSTVISQSTLQQWPPEGWMPENLQQQDIQQNMQEKTIHELYAEQRNVQPRGFQAGARSPPPPSSPQEVPESTERYSFVRNLGEHTGIALGSGGSSRAGQEQSPLP